MKKLKNKFIIVIPTFNAEDLIEECLMSVITQDFDDLGVIIRDDLSTDGTRNKIKSVLGFEDEGNEHYVNIMGKDVLFIENTEKLYPVGNTYESVINYVDNSESIIGVVDGDDKLSTSKALTKIYEIYQKEDKWLVWSQHRKSTGGIGESKPLPSDETIYAGRNYWSATHFRTSKAFLFYMLDVNDLKDPFIPNSYFTYAGDAAFIFPFCEMCGNEKSYFLDEVLYTYNCHLPTNEHNKNVNDAIKYGSYIRSNGKKYKKLNNYAKV